MNTSLGSSHLIVKTVFTHKSKTSITTFLLIHFSKFSDFRKNLKPLLMSEKNRCIFNKTQQVASYQCQHSGEFSLLYVKNCFYQVSSDSCFIIPVPERSYANVYLLPSFISAIHLFLLLSPISMLPTQHSLAEETMTYTTCGFLLSRNVALSAI